MLRQEFQDIMDRHLPGRHADDWNVANVMGELEVICPLPPDLDNEEKVYQLSRAQIGEILSEYAEIAYQAREQTVGSDQMRLMERLVMLRSIDTHWVNHLTSMENLRTGIGLQAYGQRDPLVAYRSEGHKMFQDLLARMQYDVVHSMFHVTITQEPANGRRQRNGEAVASPMQGVNSQGREKVAAAKVGRNAPCPCGSGKKYKRCHGAND
jgi:preprotein translocase subunit SecA